MHQLRKSILHTTGITLGLIVAALANGCSADVADATEGAPGAAALAGSKEESASLSSDVEAFTFADPTLVDGTISGTLSRRADGADWHAAFDVDPGSSPSTRAELRTIDTKITYDDESAPLDADGRRSASIEMRFVQADGEEHVITARHRVGESTLEPSDAASALPARIEADVTEKSAPVRGAGTELPPWFCTESCAAGCLEFVELPIGYAACVATCLAICLAD